MMKNKLTIFDRINNKMKRPNNTWKRFANSLLVFLSAFFKSRRVLGFPEHVMIEPTNVCSLKCPLCPAGSGTMKRRRGFLSLANFKKIVDEIADHIYYLTLASYGEPFLNKDINAMIAYAKRKGLIVHVMTNAQHIDDLNISTMIDERLDRIVISLDGACQASYEKYRIGGDFQKVVEAIRAIGQAKLKRRSASPSVMIQFLVMKHNEGEMEAFKDLARELKVDGVVFKKVCDMNDFPKELRDIDRYMPRDPDRRAYKLEKGSVRWNTGIHDINFCGMAWNYPAISWEGALFPCCITYDELEMGNVLETGFKKAWNSKKFMAFRRGLSGKKHLMPGCSDCGVNFYDDIIKEIYLDGPSAGR